MDKTILYLSILFSIFPNEYFFISLVRPLPSLIISSLINLPALNESSHKTIAPHFIKFIKSMNISFCSLSKFLSSQFNKFSSILERLNKEGKECIKNNKIFCNYHSLMYFEQANMYYKKYL